MPTPEAPRGDEFAERAELELLHAAAQSWLVENGDYREDRHLGAIGGLLIANSPDEYSAHISGDALRTLLPAIVERLGVGDGIDISYHPEYVTELPETGTYAYNPPSILFSIDKPITSDIGNETIFLDVPSGSEPLTDRMRYSHEGVPFALDADEPLRSIEAHEFAGNMGFLRLTRSECNDLQAIVDHLDSLVS